MRPRIGPASRTIEEAVEWLWATEEMTDGAHVAWSMWIIFGTEPGMA